MIQRHTTTDRAGFSLLEMLIASGLATTLMVLVWSLFSVYSKLNDKGSAQATELQLVRSLMRQIRSDIHHGRANAPRPREPFTGLQDSSSLRPVGELRGGDSWLRLVVRAPREEEVVGTAAPRETREFGSPDVYNIVEYAWQPVGMDRLEEQPKEQLEEQPEQQPMDSTGLTRRVIPRLASLGQRSSQEDRVPEVAKLRFRYFDGFVWQSDWDSRGRGLPVAIEITFDLESTVAQEPLEVDEVATFEQAEPLNQQRIEEPPPLSSTTAAEAEEFEYRFVVAVSPENRLADQQEALSP